MASFVNKHANVADRIAKMRRAPNISGNGFTLGWDLAVSYSESEINKLFAEHHGIGNWNIVKEPQFDVTVRDRYHRNMTRHYHIQLGLPKVAFRDTHGNSSSCEMSMTISGYFTTTDAQGWHHPIHVPISSDEDALLFTLSGISLGVVTREYHDPAPRPYASTRSAVLLKLEHSKIYLGYLEARSNFHAVRRHYIESPISKLGVIKRIASGFDFNDA
ncbi:hypothetical protein BDW59DRAFT_161842 [Aspergillus cavernicola]|uniref:Alpha-ketoglutarate-dependent dioxygenase AlkB-like domain-containing protein n=1 Tax=Aspergillus cavernicola TaxID=176166 RepID=A0ABR4IC96_9EURO